MDITDLKQREASFRLLFEDDPVPMFVLRRDTQAFLAANAAALSHYGSSRQHLLSVTLRDLHADDDELAADIDPFLSNVIAIKRRRVTAASSRSSCSRAGLTIRRRPGAVNSQSSTSPSARSRGAYRTHGAPDALTDLPNRVLFRRRMATAWRSVVAAATSSAHYTSISTTSSWSMTRSAIRSATACCRMSPPKSYASCAPGIGHPASQ